MKGFSLIELLLVIGILAILGSIGVGFYGSFSSNVELDATARAIISDLKFARSKAIAGANRYNWGLHFVNSTSSYYQFFSTSASSYTVDASTTIVSTTTLGANIVFLVPPTSSSTNAMFNAITGASASSTIIIARSSSTRSVYITPSGTVY